MDSWLVFPGLFTCWRTYGEGQEPAGKEIWTVFFHQSFWGMWGYIPKNKLMAVRKQQLLVYFQPYAEANASDIMHTMIARLQFQHPGALILVSLQYLIQHVDCKTRGNTIFWHSFTAILIPSAEDSILTFRSPAGRWWHSRWPAYNNVVLKTEEVLQEFLHVANWFCFSISSVCFV